MMKPYYQDGAVTIYHGDSLKILETIDRVDLVLTDPPYGVGGGSGTIGNQRKGRHAYKIFIDSKENIERLVVPIFRLALSKADRAIITPGPIMLTSYPAPDSFGVFYQPATAGMQRWGRADSQPIFYYGKDPRAGKTIQPSSWTLTEAPEKNGHPCPKPIKAWSRLLEKGSLAGETVLDPFMGSGTTLRAAKDLGRKAIGIELEEKYCEIAAKRMAQEVLL